MLKEAVVILHNFGMCSAQILRKMRTISRVRDYSPELNPVERLWQDLRKWLGSELPASLDALKERVAEILRSYSRETIASISGYDYLLAALPAQ
jgi:hypothetical protein